jgi:hypothetical protein
VSDGLIECVWCSDLVPECESDPRGRCEFCTTGTPVLDPEDDDPDCSCPFCPCMNSAYGGGVCGQCLAGEHQG